MRGWNATWERILREKPETVAIVVYLQIGGREFYFSDATNLSATVKRTGLVINFLPVLGEDIEIQESFSLHETSCDIPSVTISVPNAIIRAQEIISSLRRPLTGEGEIAFFSSELSYWEDRLILLKGNIDDSPTFGDMDGGEFSCTILGSYILKDRIFPELRVNNSGDKITFATAPDESCGEPYPIVYGRKIVPCICVDEERYDSASGTTVGDWLVLGHHSENNVSQIWINDENYSVQFSSSNTEDDLGNEVHILTINEGIRPDASANVYADIDTGTTQNSAGIIESILDTYSDLRQDKIDRLSLEEAKSKLSSWTLETLFNGAGASEAKVFESIENRLCESIPCLKMRWNAGQYGCIVVDFLEKTPKADLSWGIELIDRVTDVEESPRSEIFNRFELKYMYNPRINEYTKSKFRDASNSRMCRISRDLFGERDYGVIESVDITQDLVADLVLDWYVHAFTLPTYYMEYVLPLQFAWLEIGDWVEVTDENFNWEAEKALIEMIARNTRYVRIGVRIFGIFEKIVGAESE